MFSYQCSQLSTPESVIEVFNTAKRFQRGQDTTKYVSVVVLDEVGLAEDSPNLPLKALHPLLEDGTEGADDSDQVGRCTCASNMHVNVKDVETLHPHTHRSLRERRGWHSLASPTGPWTLPR